MGCLREQPKVGQREASRSFEEEQAWEDRGERE